MTSRDCQLAIVTACIVFVFAGCTSTRLPESVPGMWVEEMVKESYPVDNPKFVKSNGTEALRFEQQGRKAVVFVSLFEDPFKHERAWSESYPLKETGHNTWSFKYRDREVSIALDDKNQLQVKGLMMRSYNQDLIKKDPEPVEAIFIKKG